MSISNPFDSMSYILQLVHTPSRSPFPWLSSTEWYSHTCSSSSPSKRLQNTVSFFRSLHSITCYGFATREKRRGRYQVLLPPNIAQKQIFNMGADWLVPAYHNELKVLFVVDICQYRSEAFRSS